MVKTLTVLILLGIAGPALAPGYAQDECDGSHDLGQPDRATDALRAQLGASDDGSDLTL